MAKRQDSGSNAAHQDQPTSHNEDALPEMTDNLRGRADEDDDEFDDSDDVDEADEEDTDEGTD